MRSMSTLPSGYVHPISDQILQRLGTSDLDWYDPSAVQLSKEGNFTLGFQHKDKVGEITTSYNVEQKGHLLEVTYDGNSKKYALFDMGKQAWSVRLDLDGILAMVDDALTDLR